LKILISYTQNILYCITKGPENT